jgi:hypothetical protein
MSNDFNWQTDDNTAWEEGAGETQPDSAKANLTAWLKRRSRWLGVAAVLFLITGVAIYSLFDRQVEKVEDANTAGVLAAHALVRQAALEKDFELLAVLMADNGRNWNQMQLELLNINLFLDRRPFGLTMLPGNGSGQTNTPQVTISPDLQTAELVEQIPYYTGPAGGQPSEIVLLEQTFHYQRRGDSWLLAPPPEGSPFLDDGQTIEKEYLTIVYPQQEEAFVGGYLAQKMDDLVGRICEENTVKCPPGLKIELRLQSDPSSLRLLNLNFFGLSLNDAGTGEFEFFLLSPINLPSSTVVGRPIDEDGREALYHGYANWLAASMVTSFTEAQLNRETLEDKLAVWGLEPPPEPLTALPLPQPIPAPPIPFPEQDILLACSDGRSFTMLRYNPRANSWLDELDGRETTYLSSQFERYTGSFMLSLPDDNGVLVRMRQLSSGEYTYKLVLWRDGQEQLVLESSDALVILDEFIQRRYDPSGRYYVLYNVSGNGEGLPYAVDLTACSTGDCELQNYNGQPYWSPDLSRLLLVTIDDQPHLTLRDERTGEEIPLGIGFSPIWADNENFTYYRFLEGADPNLEGGSKDQILTANVNDPLDARLLLDRADVAAVLPDNELAVEVGIQSVIAHPYQPDWLFLAAGGIHTESGAQITYLLSLRQDTGELDMIFDLDRGRLASPPQITPDGRYLSVPIVGTPPGGSSFVQYLALIPLESADMLVGEASEIYETNRGVYHDWSLDGGWLLISDQSFIRLIAPGYDYDQVIHHDIDACHEALWINPQ